MTNRELAKVLKFDQSKVNGAIYTASDGRAEPFKAVPAMARAAQKAGCLIIENCAVRSIEKTAGRISSVITEKGEVHTQAVVCAGGGWSSTFLANIGVSFPQLLVKGTVARTHAAPDVFPGAAASHKIAFRRRQDGGYTLALGDYLEHYVGDPSFRYLFKFLPAFKQSRKGIRLRLGGDLSGRLFPQRHWEADEITPFEQTRVLDPDPSPWAVKQMQKRVAECLPALSGIGIEEAWAGMIDAPPDYVPVMDEVSDFSGFFLASGFSGHGFGIGPGAGKVMAGMVQGKTPEYDLKRFRFDRFIDGSPIIPGPAL